MTAKGYIGMMIKEAVAKKLRVKAKESGKTITVFLDEVLDKYSTAEKEVLQKGSTITKAESYDKMIKKVEEMQEDIKAVREILEEARR